MVHICLKTYKNSEQPDNKHWQKLVQVLSNSVDGVFLLSLNIILSFLAFTLLFLLFLDFESHFQNFIDLICKFFLCIARGEVVKYLVKAPQVTDVSSSFLNLHPSRLLPSLCDIHAYEKHWIVNSQLESQICILLLLVCEVHTKQYFANLDHHIVIVFLHPVFNIINIEKNRKCQFQKNSEMDEVHYPKHVQFIRSWERFSKSICWHQHKNHKESWDVEQAVKVHSC